MAFHPKRSPSRCRGSATVLAPANGDALAATLESVVGIYPYRARPRESIGNSLLSRGWRAYCTRSTPPYRTEGTRRAF
eukprot:613676-Pyramimonas_sp.AAC.1